MIVEHSKYASVCHYRDSLSTIQISYKKPPGISFTIAAKNEKQGGKKIQNCARRKMFFAESNNLQNCWPPPGGRYNR